MLSRTRPILFLDSDLGLGRLLQLTLARVSVGEFDILQGESLYRRLQSGFDPISEFVWQQCSERARLDLSSLAADANRERRKHKRDDTEADRIIREAGFQRVLAPELDRLIREGPVYSETRFAPIHLSAETVACASTFSQGEYLIRANLMLLEEAFPTELRNRASVPYEVVIETDPSKAIETALRVRPDTVLISAYSSDWNTLELAKQLQGNPLLTKTAILLMVKHGGDWDNPLIDGFPFIAKPFSLNGLFHFIDCAHKLLAEST